MNRPLRLGGPATFSSNLSFTISASELFLDSIDIFDRLPLVLLSVDIAACPLVLASALDSFGNLSCLLVAESDDVSEGFSVLFSDSVDIFAGLGSDSVGVFIRLEFRLGEFTVISGTVGSAVFTCFAFLLVDAVGDSTSDSLTRRGL